MFADVYHGNNLLPPFCRWWCYTGGLLLFILWTPYKASMSLLCILFRLNHLSSFLFVLLLGGTAQVSALVVLNFCLETWKCILSAPKSFVEKLAVTECLLCALPLGKSRQWEHDSCPQQLRAQWGQVKLAQLPPRECDSCIGFLWERKSQEK